MLKLNSFAFSIVLSSMPIRIVQGNECMTDGGYDYPTPCVTECLEVDNTNPFKGSTDVPVNPTEESSYSFAWCATIDNYDRTNTNRRKSWGYCNQYCELAFNTSSPSLSPTITPTASPTVAEYFADGGKLENGETEPCVIPFTIPEFSGSTEYYGCIDMTLFEPFPGTGGDFPFPAVDSRTNTSQWCSLLPEYDRTPGDTPLRKEWGYCLFISSIESPTPAPTEPTTSAPTTTPTTAPTFPHPTLSPTASPTIETKFIASGGGRLFADSWNGTENIGECLFPFRIAGLVNQDLQEVPFSSCVSFETYTPYMLNDSTWSGPEAPLSELEETYGSSQWCAVDNERYTPTGDEISLDRYKWAYCFEIPVNPQMESTSSPTMTPSGSPTKAPSFSPSFLPTSSPTFMQDQDNPCEDMNTTEPCNETEAPFTDFFNEPTIAPSETPNMDDNITSSPTQSPIETLVVPTPFPTTGENEYEYAAAETNNINTGILTFTYIAFSWMLGAHVY
eukprot:augustus_masked-scaffold_1-processed-gene-30.15-mRNA-1 protein AED:1.00 eAED:1.00 QI:0/-1/0/0/-1/1/1/0/503